MARNLAPYHAHQNTESYSYDVSGNHTMADNQCTDYRWDYRNRVEKGVRKGVKSLFLGNECRPGRRDGSVAGRRHGEKKRGLTRMA